MLDSVSLRSEYYHDVFHILYELYIKTSELESCTKLSMRPTSLFIIRSCLGWLFDQPNVPNEYYSYRQNRKQINSLFKTFSPSGQSEFTAVQIFVPSSVSRFFEGDHQVFLSRDGEHKEHNNDSILSAVLEKKSSRPYAFAEDVNERIANTESNQKSNEFSLIEFDPMLETVLNAACPFLADFRVSIMPRRNAKTVSRTGRYRHITPKIYETPTRPKTVPPTQLTEDEKQTKLVEAFLHSQSLSVRRTVEFVQERVFSAVVKDFQVEILIPFKKTVIETVDNIQLNEPQAILDELYRIYANGEKSLLEKWQEFVTPAALERVKVRVQK